VTNQVLALRRAGVDTLFIFGTPTPTIRTYATMAAIGWKPDNIFLNSVSATDTFMGIAVARCGRGRGERVNQASYYTKDPANPTWANDAGMKLYKSIMAGSRRRTRRSPTACTSTAWRRRTPSSRR
jgi:branched-chain amino acid transport system substrate-binding protein